MHNKKSVWSLLLIFGLLSAIGLKAADNSGLAFLKLPVDARTAAMGEASVALSGDAAAAFNNPALLSANVSRSFVWMHNAYLADIAQEFAAFQFKSGRHSMALSLNVMDIPGIEIRGTRPTTQPEGKTDAINFAFGLSYAYRYNAQWAFGVTGKYLFEKYYLASAAGFAVDLGVLRRDLFFNGLHWALAVQNLGRMQKLKDERTELPLTVRSGLQYDVPLGWSVLKTLALAAELQQVLHQGTQARLGVEAPLADVIYLRAGTIFSSRKMRFSLGVGLAYKNYRVHYAFSPFPYNLGNSHRFSISWRF